MKRMLVIAVAMAGLLGPLRGDELEKGFATPPDSAKPWVYWFWESGNISREGITADLEAMQRVGIGGAVVMCCPHLPAGPVKFFSAEWRELFAYTVKEAGRLGLELAFTNGDGATGSGGPWIHPPEAMQELVWSETQCEGPTLFNAGLPQPPTKLNYYRDVVVLAFPTPPDELARPAEQTPKVTANFTPFNGRNIVDGDPLSRVNLPVAKRGETMPFVQLEFYEPVWARAIRLNISGISEAELQRSNDGVHFETVSKLDLPVKASKPNTFTFAEVKARYYRLVFPSTARRGKQTVLRDLELMSAPRVNRWELKAGFAEGGPDFPPSLTLTEAGRTQVVRREQVVDLTRQMDNAGRLYWDVPAGRWTVLRIGFTPTGMETHSATPAGKGLECDKLNARGIETQFANLGAKLLDDAGSFAGKTLRYGHIDSWEVGSQNWTAEFPAEFRKRRGYDLCPLLPVMAGGRVVDNVEMSERFLFDVRRTLGELLVEKYFGRMRELCHARGLKFEAEATGPGIRTTADQLQCKACTDIPMGEFWISPTGELGRDCKEAASAAHIGGQAIAAAESFTSWPTRSRWQKDPFGLKPYGDRAFCAGINRLVLLNYVHQPWTNRAPGLTLGPFGTELGRTVTWWEQSPAWISYLTRCQYLLQQGVFVGDVCYFIGEGAPVGAAKRSELLPALPSGYDYDSVNTSALLAMTVCDGQLVLPSGMRYRLLVLPDAHAMTPALLRKIGDLLEAGANILVGNKPAVSPSLENFPACDAEVATQATRIWGNNREDVAYAVGQGKVFRATTLDKVLKALAVPPDFASTSSATDVHVEYIHRRMGDTDLYFVANWDTNSVNTLCTFRVTGREPEFWHPDTGEIEAAPAFNLKSGSTQIPIHFDPAGSLFVIFRKPTALLERVAPNRPPPQILVELSGAWEVTFDPQWGGPSAPVIFDQLEDWTKRTEPGIRYYSGTAVYRKTFRVPSIDLRQSKIMLDLGGVKNLAGVTLNGRALGTLWKPPFCMPVTDALKVGENILELRIVNLWPNRLIGDEQLPDDCAWLPTGALQEWPAWLLDGRPRPVQERFAFTTWKHWHKTDRLLSSGLLGPVTLQVAKKVMIE